MGLSSSARMLWRPAIAALAAFLVCGSLWAAAPGEPQPAVWTARKAQFVYMGFTTHYSCDGLRDRIRDILLLLGARRDLQVIETGCIRFQGPEPFPGVLIKMHVLTPAPEGQTEHVVAAHWKSVNLLAHESTLNASGECELYEQVKEKLLPLFSVRHLDYSTTCVPHQLSVGGVLFKAEVLAPDQPAG